MEAIVITKENFEEQVLRAEKPVLVDFWAPWCTYCRRIAPAVDQVAGQYGEQMVVGKVNVDEQPELAERFGVETIPTLLVFRNGQAGEPLIAPGSKAQIVEWAGLDHCHIYLLIGKIAECHCRGTEQVDAHQHVEGAQAQARSKKGHGN